MPISYWIYVSRCGVFILPCLLFNSMLQTNLLVLFSLQLILFLHLYLKRNNPLQFYPDQKYFILAPLVLLVTNIMTGSIWLMKCPSAMATGQSGSHRRLWCWEWTQSSVSDGPPTGTHLTFQLMWGEKLWAGKKTFQLMSGSSWMKVPKALWKLIKTN